MINRVPCMTNQWVYLLIFLFSSLTATASSGKNSVVKVIHAEGRIYYSEIYVTWSTEYEKAPCDFVLEASQDGEDWRIRGRVRSKGDANKISDYVFVDHKVNTYKYYRIRRLDPRSGSEVLTSFQLENYSIEVDLEELEFLETKSLVLEYSIDKDQQLVVRIYNRIGRQVLTKVMPSTKAGEYIYHLDISHLERDNYLLQVDQVLLDRTVAEQAFKVD